MSHLYVRIRLNATKSLCAIGLFAAARQAILVADGSNAIHDYAAELHDRRSVAAETDGRVLALLDTVGVVELTALVGYYTMVAMTLNAHELPLPESAAPPFAPASA